MSLRAVIKTIKSYKRELPNNRYLVYELHTSKWRTEINMELWEHGNPFAIAFETKKYWNLERFCIPKNKCVLITGKKVNQQSQRVAGINIFNMNKIEAKYGKRK